VSRRRCANADEADVHSRWRHVLACTARPGYCAAVKRRTNRRERREGQHEALRQLAEMGD
jgi:hypothetical protein